MKKLLDKCKDVLMHNRMCCMICILVLLESFIAERKIFHFSNMTFDKVMTYIVAKLLIVLLTVAVYKGVLFLLNIKSDRLKVFKVSFFIIMIWYIAFMFLCWPGLWCGDNHIIFIKAVNLTLWAPQSIITGMIYIVSMMILPHPISIVLFQLIVGAIIGAYTISVLYEIFLSKKVYWAILIFVSIPTVYFLLYTMRGGLFAFCILLIEMLLLEISIKKEIPIKLVIMLSVIAGVTAAWRGEAIIILPIFICMLICLRKQLRRKDIIKSAIIVLCVFSCIKCVEGYTWRASGNYNEKNQYSLTPFITGLSRIVTSPDVHSNKLEEDLYNIDQIISLNDLRAYPSDLAPFDWQAEIGIRKEFTEEEYNRGVKSIINLVLRNLDTYVLSKLQLVMHSTGLSTQEGFLYSGYSDESAYNILKDYGEEEYASLFKPLNTDLREKVYKNMIGYYAIFPYTRDVYYLIWQLWIPIVLLLVTTVYFLIRRYWILFWGQAIAAGEFVMTFMLCTGENVYYFIPFFLTGWISIILFIGSKYFVKKAEVRDV